MDTPKSYMTKQDFDVSYACVYGSSLGDQQDLLEENVFDCK